MILIYTLVTWLPVGELGNTVNQTKTNEQKNIIRLYFVQLVVDNTEWFKINLTLFISHISHKWGNIMNLFEDFHKV